MKNIITITILIFNCFNLIAATNCEDDKRYGECIKCTKNIDEIAVIYLNGVNNTRETAQNSVKIIEEILEDETTLANINHSKICTGYTYNQTHGALTDGIETIAQKLNEAEGLYGVPVRVVIGQWWVKALNLDQFRNFNKHNYIASFNKISSKKKVSLFENIKKELKKPLSKFKAGSWAVGSLRLLDKYSSTYTFHSMSFNGYDFYKYNKKSNISEAAGYLIFKNNQFVALFDMTASGGQVKFVPVSSFDLYGVHYDIFEGSNAGGVVNVLFFEIDGIEYSKVIGDAHRVKPYEQFNEFNNTN